jgi:hypothetical protein
VFGGHASDLDDRQQLASGGTGRGGHVREGEFLINGPVSHSVVTERIDSSLK